MSNKLYVIVLVIIASFFLFSYFGIARNINPYGINREELIYIDNVKRICENLCIYIKENLSIENISGCLSSPGTITGKYWWIENWGCSVGNACEGLYQNYIIINENCTTISIIYNNKPLNI